MLSTFDDSSVDFVIKERASQRGRERERERKGTLQSKSDEGGFEKWYSEMIPCQNLERKTVLRVINDRKTPAVNSQNKFSPYIYMELEPFRCDWCYFINNLYFNIDVTWHFSQRVWLNIWRKNRKSNLVYKNCK